MSVLRIFAIAIYRGIASIDHPYWQALNHSVGCQQLHPLRAGVVMRNSTPSKFESQSQLAIRLSPRLQNTYRVGQKSKLLIISEYVNKTEKRGDVNKNEQLQRKWSIVWYFRVKYFTSQLFCLNILWLKAVTARQTQTGFAKLKKVCSIENLTTQIELVLPTFKFWTVHKII